MMTAVPPNDLGSSFYRNTLSLQGRSFYDLIVSHFMRKDYSGVIPVTVVDQPAAAKDCFAAFKAVRDDRPEFFFLGNEAQFAYRRTQGTIICSMLYSPSEIERIQFQLRKTICRLVTGSANLPLIRQEVMVYERIARRLNYENNGDVRDHSIVGPVLLSAGVCEGYNALLLLAFRRLGIPCIKVYGESRERELHCWTIAWINGTPVHCDVTWDRPVNGVVCFNYLNLSDAQIGRDHFAFSKAFMPRCVVETLNYYYANGYSVSSLKSLYTYLNTCNRYWPGKLIYLQINYADTQSDIHRAVQTAWPINGACYRILHINPFLKTIVLIVD